MRPFRGGLWVCAVVMLALEVGAAHAAWDNVFQTCCWNCRSRTSASFYAPPACCPAPQPACCPQPQYVQRCYYQPVVTYQTRTYYEPVTTNRTSYYYEPVVSYRYSCYYDPCTCSYQQVATPVTSYQLRSQCCPVQSWVQRCAVVPVTTYQQKCCYEPVTPACPPPCPPAAAPAVTEQSNFGAPAVTEQRSAPPMHMDKSSDRIAPMPGGTSGSSYRQLPPLRPPVPAANPPSPPKIERVVSLQGGTGDVQGQVLQGDQAPRSGTQLVFASATRAGTRQTVSSDRDGRFRISLASGEWLVFVNGADGQETLYGKIDIRGNETRQITVLSR